jgi:hypothetical protein
MRAGDLVRFRECTWHVEPKKYTDWKIGLLVEYKPWMKIAQILYEGKEYKIQANDVQIHKRAKRD